MTSRLFPAGRRFTRKSYTSNRSGIAAREIFRPFHQYLWVRLPKLPSRNRLPRSTASPFAHLANLSAHYPSFPVRRD